MKTKHINIKQVEYLYENLPSALFATAIITIVLFFSFDNLVPAKNLNIWVSLSLLVVFLRAILYIVYKCYPIKNSTTQRYYYAFFIGVLTSALIWGSSVFYIFPNEREYQILLLLILGGLSSGSVVSTASRVELFYVFLIFSLAPYVYIFNEMHQGISETLSLFVLFYIVILFMISRKIAKNVNENIILVCEKGLLVEELNTKIEEANSSNKAKSQFLSSMSHEIRTPMNAIIGFVKLLKKLENEPTKMSYLNIVDSSSNLLLNILNDILDISKIEAGKLSIEMLEFNPNEEFNLTYNLYKTACSEKGVHLINSINTNLPASIVSDKHRLQQIISNLLSNALKFTPAGKAIELIVNYKEETSSLHVEVKDEGIGIEENNIETILQEFSQADSSTARKYGGTGLGLSIVSKLLGLLHSSLHVKSKLNEGSSFSFEVQVEVANEAVPLVKDEVIDSEAICFEDKNILVAEDNKTNQMLIEILLEELGLHVSIAKDGVEAVKMATESTYDIILMDINMPNKNGIEAMHDIKALGLSVPIVALTANAVSGDKNKYIKEGFDNYLSKPIDNEALETLLKQYLR